MTVTDAAERKNGTQVHKKYKLYAPTKYAELCKENKC